MIKPVIDYLFIACLKNWTETIEELPQMICGRGSDSHTISFYGRKAKILKEDEKLYGLKFYKQRVNSCPLDSNIIPMILKKNLPQSRCQKCILGNVFSKLHWLILNQCYLTLKKMSMYRSLDGWHLSNTVYSVSSHSVTDTVLIGKGGFSMLKQIQSNLDTSNNQC